MEACIKDRLCNITTRRSYRATFIFNLFDQKKLYFLPDTIIDTKLIKQNQIQNEIIHNKMEIDRYYMSAGRLTKQKIFLI